MPVFAEDDRAVRAIQEARLHWLVGRGDLDKAAASAIKDPFNASMLARLGARAEAIAELRREFANTPGNPNHRRDIALWAGHFGDPELALAAMRTVVDAQPAQMAYVWMPQLKAMRQLAEFRDYMREIGMVDYREKYKWPDFCHALEHDFECN